MAALPAAAAHARPWNGELAGPGWGWAWMEEALARFERADPAARGRKARSTREVAVKGGGGEAVFERQALEAVRFECSMAMNGAGGLGMAGVLLGTRAGDRMHVAGWRPLPCEHARGPEFLLSARDEARMASYLEGVRAQAAMEGREVVGWFVSHPRGGSAPTLEEVEIQRRFLPGEPLLMIVEPDRAGDLACQAYWSGTHQMGEQFMVRPLGRDEPAGETPAAVGAERAEERPAGMTMPGPAAAWAAAALAAVIFAGGAMWATADPAAPAVAARPAVAPLEMVSLHAEPRGKRIAVVWNGNARVVREAVEAGLVIRDGSRESQIRLKPRDAVRGWKLVRGRRANLEVTIELKTAGGRMFRESTVYRGGTAGPEVSKVAGGVIAAAAPAAEKGRVKSKRQVRKQRRAENSKADGAQATSQSM